MAQFNSSTIEKLGANNYASWIADIKYILMERGLWDIIDQEKTYPVKTATLSEADLEKAITRYGQALSTIYLNVNPEYRKIIEGCVNPSEALKLLKNNYCPDSRAHIMKLTTQLAECKINSGETINLYAARLNRLSKEIKDIKKNFDITDTCYQLLRYLPARYDQIVQSILRWSDDDFIFSKIVLELSAEESRLNLRSVDRNRNGASINVVHRKRNTTKSCWTCGRQGHFQRQCKQNRKSNSSVVPYNEQSRGSGTLEKDRHRSPSPGGRGTGRSRPGAFHTEKETHYVSTFYISQANIAEGKGSETQWILDTGASHHFCCERSLFNNFKILQNESMAIAIKEMNFPIEGTGDIELKFGGRLYTFKNVMYSPKLRKNIISGSRIDIAGASFLGKNRQIKVISNNTVLFRAFLKNGTYRLYPKYVKKVKFESASIDKLSKIELWHRRCGHIHPDVLDKTSRLNCVRGLPKFDIKSLDCEECKLNKYRRVSFKPKDRVRSHGPLDLICADLWGPCPTEGINGERYYLSIIDEFSKYVSVYPLKCKSDTFELVRRHILRIENQTGKKVKVFRSDNGGEFKNFEFEDFFNNKGIKHEFTNAYTPEQNGIVERYNQTLIDGVRTILNSSKTDKNFWPEAVKYFSYIWNRVCSGGSEQTPLELFYGRIPSLKHLKPFGSVAYVGIFRGNRTKLEPKATKGIMVGFAHRTKGYRIWLPEQNKIIETINVSFSETKRYNEQNFESRSGAVMGQGYIPADEIFGSGESASEKVSEETSGSSIPESSTETPDEPEPQISSPAEGAGSSPRHVTWIRKAVTRPDKSRTDIYYFEKGTDKGRIRSMPEAERYCAENHIHFNKEIFDFKGKNKFSGEVAESANGSDLSLAQK